MTPKEKAGELVDKFSDLEDGEMYIGKAKQCALIAVDEILKSVPKQPSISITMPHFEATVYWEKVKSELEKL
jgi:hypothetical protein